MKLVVIYSLYLYDNERNIHIITIRIIIKHKKAFLKIIITVANYIQKLKIYLKYRFQDDLIHKIILIIYSILINVEAQILDSNC